MTSKNEDGPKDKSEQAQSREGKKSSRSQDYNIFIRHRTYPNAGAVFTVRHPPLSELAKDCLVVLDTNVLVLPYGVGKDSLETIKSTYQLLIKSKRLVVPGQVAREFADVRSRKLAELHQRLSKKRDGFSAPVHEEYPLLKALPEYTDLAKIEREIHEKANLYRKALNALIERVRDWSWNDPVSELYGQLFDDSVVFDFDLNDAEMTRIESDLESRHLHNIPPGYKDRAKDDRGIGDLLIWNSILKLGAQHSRHVLFVSADEKADWWHQSENLALYPRYELVDEFRRFSGGKSFHIVRFSKFLELFNAAISAIEEVRVEEQSAVAVVVSETPSVITDVEAKAAVLRWFQANGFQLISKSEMQVDFLVRNDAGEFGVDVRNRGSYRDASGYLGQLVLWSSFHQKRSILVIVCRNYMTARAFYAQFVPRLIREFSGALVLVGSVDGERCFLPVNDGTFLSRGR